MSEFTLDAIYTFAPTLISRSSALIGTHSLIVSLFDVSRALGNDFYAEREKRKREKKEKNEEKKGRRIRRGGRSGGSFLHASMSLCAPSNERKFM